MKTNAMRAPLIKAGGLLLVFVLLAYLTSVSPEGGLLDSFGLMIIGVFRLVQWAIAMIIGVAVCIAALIGIFLFTVFLYDRETASDLAARTTIAIRELLAPVFTLVDSLRKQPRAVSPEAAPAIQPAVPQRAEVMVDADKLQEERQALIAVEIRKVVDSQQSLHDQLVALNAKIDSIEERSAAFTAADQAAADQVTAIADEISASNERLDAAQGSVADLEGRLGDIARKLQDLTQEKLLGDLPNRLRKLEQQGEPSVFDPRPLNESVQALQKEVAELRKKGTGKAQASGGKARKKA